MDNKKNARLILALIYHAGCALVLIVVASLLGMFIVAGLLHRVVR